MTQPFLVEIGTEELPPKALYNLSLEFRELFRAQLIEANLHDGERGISLLKHFASPRRLAILATNVPEKTPPKNVVNWGPPANISFDTSGKPTKAAESFAKKNGIPVDQLEVGSDGATERLIYKTRGGDELVIDLLPSFVESALKNLSIPKRMRWGARRNEFVRPVHWIVMLFGKHLIDCEILGIKAGRETRGHRFHCPQKIALQSPADYQPALEKAYVIADFSERRSHIRAQVEIEGKKLNGVAIIDENLLDEVTALVEWPVAFSGSFEERFLQVPQEALISSMKGHQKYFHVVDANGKLLPHFITVANIESKDPRKVIDGNERVIRPRLSDAAFFYETDLKTPLVARREQLKTVVFQEKLGTVFDKTERIAELAEWIVEQIGGKSVTEDAWKKDAWAKGAWTPGAWAKKAAELCKADLVSNMVGEFDEMQGIAGAYYARHDGEPEEIAQAIREHYLPRFAGDELPITKIGIAIALADRLDTLVGIFLIGQPPTGSKDPFALRRAALGILRIIVERGLELDLRSCISFASHLFPNNVIAAAKSDVRASIFDYVIERFRAWYEDENIPAEVFLAVSAKQLSTPLDIHQRVQAVHRFSQLPEAQALAAANKRVSNLLAKTSDGKSTSVKLQVDDLLSSTTMGTPKLEPSELQLTEQLSALYKEVQPLFAQRKYREGLEKLASLRTAVDAFFDNVMVMTDDEAVRNNRLALLSQLRNLFLEVADISLLASTTKDGAIKSPLPTGEG
jgi:glycyl-tRNA synthetase beta chain